MISPAWLAVVWLGAASPAPQMDSFEDCDTLRQAEPDARLGYLCYYRHGRLANVLGQARERLEAIVADEPGNAWAAVFLANVLVDLGDRATATKLNREALPTLMAREDIDDANKALMALDFATMLRAQGHYDEALTHFTAARDYAARTDRPALHAMTQLELADTRFELGAELAPLRELVDAALPIVVEQGQYVMSMKALVIAADVAFASGDLATAIAHRERVVEIAAAEGDDYLVAGTQAMIASLRIRNFDPRLPWADPTPYREETEAALEACKRADNSHGEAIALCTLGAIEPDTARAIEHFRACERLHERSDYVAGAFGAKTYLAQRLADSGETHFDEALAYAEQVVVSADASGEIDQRMRARIILAETRWRVGRHEEATEAGLDALDLLELLRDVDVDTQDRTHTLDRYAFAYYLVSGKLLGNRARTDDDLELAFSTMERLRARSLLERLAVEDVDDTDDPQTPQVVERKEVLADIARTQRRLRASAAGTDAHASLRSELETLERRERTLRTAIARDDPRFATLHTPAPPTLASVRAALEPDEAIVAFQLADERDHTLGDEGGAWLLVITRDDVATYRIPDRYLLGHQVPMISGLIVTGDPAASAALVRLHDDLLGEALAALPATVQRLVIVPDGVLYDVPFGALQPSPSGPRLAERFEITLGPSVTSWLRWRQDADALRPGVLALADDNAQAAAPAAFRGALEATRDLGALPRAATEVRLIADILGDATVRVGDEASEAYLKSASLADFGVLHLAAHAVVDQETPERSGVVLRAGGPDEDGLLQVREIVDLDLDGRVVMLSTCSGLAGTAVRGEGLMSLSRAFILAGAEAVVASRYPLHDSDAMQLFARLYHHLDAGRSLSTALALARRELIAAGAPEAAWSGVIVLGNGDVVLRPRTPLQRWWRELGPWRIGAASVALLVGLVALMLALSQRRRLHGHARA